MHVYAPIPPYRGAGPECGYGVCSIRAGVGRSLVASVTCACTRSQRGANGYAPPSPSATLQGAVSTAGECVASQATPSQAVNLEGPHLVEVVEELLRPFVE